VAKEGVVTSEDMVPDIVDNGRFGFQFTGYFKAEEKGLYHFHLTSDDGSKMLLNDQVLIDNDGLHSAQTVTEPVALREGYYKVTILFAEGGGGYTLNLKAGFPDGTTQELSPKDFER
jgi:hexosaminidase